ncbi:MAG TPA: hypothetical protein PKM43_07475 [Verrucomicrobiota bacterium]|nr:hypothetical protein [Verrucomicrobiota bacterium]HRZ56892.1 hypothetical protein [Candidatus Paceibacterota bacterium]
MRGRGVRGGRGRWFSILALACAALVGEAAQPPASAVPDSPELKARVMRGELGFTRLLLLQRRPITPSHVYTYHCEGLQPGGGLLVLDLGTGALTRLLDSSQGVLLDCELSYDGREIVLSWMADMQRFQVYRMNVDGTGLKQLTEGDAYNFNACWLPDGGIAFLSTRRSAYAYCWSSPAGILHRMNREGGEVRQLSANYLNDFTPSVLPDGRIIYSRWEYVDRPAIPIQSLWTINPDGTGLRIYYGNRVLSPATFMEPRAIPGSVNILCLLTAHNGPCRGAIGVIDRREGVNAQAAIRNLTPEVGIGRVEEGDGNFVHGPYESALPLDDRYFVVSRDGALLIRDYAGTEQAVVLARGDSPLGSFNAQPVRPRPRPAIIHRDLAVERSNEVWATLYVQDVYAGLGPEVARGEIAEIRVVEEIAKPVSVSPDRRLFGFQFPVVSCGATYAPKKIWGSARVAADGSAAFRVPSDVPLYFMALDAEGRAVQRMRSFTHLKAGEVQGCVGCHEDRRMAQARGRRPEALRRPPQELDPPDWGVKGFSYLEVVQPVLDRHCVTCHNAREHPRGVDLSGDRTDIFNVSYEILARKGTPAEDAHQGGAAMAGFRNPYTSWIPTYNGTEENILQIQPRAWGSPASKLAHLVRAGHPDAQGKPRVDLTSDERCRIYAWIDCNVPYYPTSASHDLEIPGCRRIYPPELDRVLDDVARRRCASCHQEGKIPRTFYTRITNPQANAFLLAPLAKTAGGTERCGQPTFASADDPDYRAILRTFEPALRALEARPRLDVAEGESGGAEARLQRETPGTVRGIGEGCAREHPGAPTNG